MWNFFTKELYHDRWLPWTIGLACAATLFLWGQIEVYSIEQEIEYIEAQASYASSIASAHKRATKEEVREIEEVSEPYMACGCGCCGGGVEKVEERCLYHARGDDIEKIRAEDKKAKTAPICSIVGCSVGVRYKYCD
ncbi:MAG: hypothetical protein AAB372_00560 [Patescibacteria group bacterium]